MNQTPTHPHHGDAGAAWIPQQPGPFAQAERPAFIDYEPAVYPPLSEAPQWVLAPEVYAPLEPGPAPQEQRYRRLTAGIIALAIVFVGGGSITVAASHTAKAHAAPVASLR